MNKDFVIDIKGTQKFENDSDIINVTTLGHYCEKSTGRYITYKEYDSDGSENGEQTSVVKIGNDNMVTITRIGKFGSRLTLENNRRHQCHYSTVAGDLMIGIFTNKMNIDLNENGGMVEVGYTIDFNSGLVSENEIKISVKKASDDYYTEKE